MSEPVLPVLSEVEGSVARTELCRSVEGVEPKGLPAYGGKVGAYKMQRRSGGNWQDVATAIETESTLVEGKELEYRDGGASFNSRI